MSVRKAILKTKIEEEIVELLVKSRVDNIYLTDGTTTLASKLSEMVTSINGKATSQDIQNAIKDIPTSENVSSMISTAVSNLKGGVGTEYDTLKKLADAITGEVARATGVEAGLQTAIDNINSATTGILKQSKDYTDAEISKVEAKVAGAFHFKGSVDYVKDLPTNDVSEGDVYEVKYTGTSGTKALNAEYAYNGTDWVEMGSFVDLSSYATTESVNTAISTAKTEVSGQITALANGAVKTNTDNISSLETKVNGLSAIKVSESQPTDLKAGDIWAQLIQ